MVLWSLFSHTYNFSSVDESLPGSKSPKSGFFVVSDLAAVKRCELADKGCDCVRTGTMTGTNTLASITAERWKIKLTFIILTKKRRQEIEPSKLQLPLHNRQRGCIPYVRNSNLSKESSYQKYIGMKMMKFRISEMPCRNLSHSSKDLLGTTT